MMYIKTFWKIFKDLECMYEWIHVVHPRFKAIENTKLCVFLAGLFHNKIIFVVILFLLLHTKQMQKSQIFLKDVVYIALKVGEFSNHRTTIAISSNTGLFLKDIYVVPYIVLVRNWLLKNVCSERNEKKIIDIITQLSRNTKFQAFMFEYRILF